MWYETATKEIGDNSFFKAVTWSRNIPSGFAKYKAEIIPCSGCMYVYDAVKGWKCFGVK